MAKFKKGDKIVDWCGREGSIIDIQRFSVNLPNGKKHTSVKYLVKWDKPTLFNTWATMDAEKITKIPKEPKQPKATYHVSLFNADSGNKIMLATRVVGGKHISFGFSVCHEDDKFDFGIGEQLAKFRAKKYPFRYYFNDKGKDSDITPIQDKCIEDLKKNWKNPHANIIRMNDILEF